MHGTLPLGLLGQPVKRWSHTHRETRRETETMTKLTLVSDYHYTQQPRDYTYYVYYKL
jgi:hypothetical protein